MKKKMKLQVPSKARGPGFPKWIPPEKRMRVYDESLPNEKQPWVLFQIVVPDEYTKEQLQAAFEFIHDNNSVMNNDFIAINAIAHSYLDETLEKGCPSCITVDPKLYKKLTAHRGF